MKTLSALAGAAGASAAGSRDPATYGIDVDGTSVAVTTRTDRADAVPLARAAHSGDPAYRDIRVAYEVQAEASGFDPRSVRPGSTEDAQVLADLAQTLARAGAQPRGERGVASSMTSLRAQAEATVKLRFAGGETGLGPAALTDASRAPGAEAAARMLPEIQVARQAAPLLGRTPATAVAATAGAAAGTALAVGLGALSGPAAAPGSAEGERTSARAALDTDGDGRLQCKEIGRWIPDVGFDSRSLNARTYQTFINGHWGEDFEVTTAATGKVRFDGCIDRGRTATLLEAKAKHGVLLTERTSGWSQAQTTVAKQGPEQQRASRALGVEAEWHAQTAVDVAGIQRIFQEERVALPVHHTPMPIAR